MKKLVLILAFFWVQISIAQIVNIPDANFKAALIEEGVDTNNDGEIQESEAEAVMSLVMVDKGITSIEGVLSFTNVRAISIIYNNINSITIHGLSKLEQINVEDNNLTSLEISDLPKLELILTRSNQLTSLEISNFPKLTSINCRYNQLSNLVLSNLPELSHLSFYGNELSYLNLLNLSKLEAITGYNNQLATLVLPNPSIMSWIALSNNQLTSLDLSNQSNLEVLDVSLNELTSLELTNSPNLKELFCHEASLTSLDLSNNVDLVELSCQGNEFISLDLSNQSKLEFLRVGNSSLETLNIKNGLTQDLDIGTVPNLKFICTDNSEAQEVQDLMFSRGYSDCVVNSFCTFEPGGDVYYVEGNVKVDIDQDGCDPDDIGFPFTQIKVSDTNGGLGIYSSELDGSYNIPLPEGDYTIDYQFPYMSYFDISPPSFTVSFPTDTSPFQQDICLTPNGTHNDLQIAIIPLEVARPGFDTDYKIVYANVGTTLLSGDVAFSFDEDVLDFVNASINPDTQNTGELSWSFTNLAPFEFKIIDVTMNLNAPTDTPPLNDGDILCYEATISPTAGDETLEDNSFSLKQTVVNSFDPNDKTCLEGDVITPDLVGEYVHYLIRFENTGSASAVNIVVKDVIDTNKFDMESFVPMNSSHDYVTRIQNNNEVEFIFENINLPFDDANNDGFVMFKIKTLPSLVIGDTFENSAEIYFDFNFPIITNVEQTTVDTTASTDNFTLNSHITVFPNPANDLLQIESQLEFDSIVIYDLTGKELKRIVSTENRLTQELNVSNLKSGIYYISIQSGNSKTTEKFLKI